MPPNLFQCIRVRVGLRSALIKLLKTSQLCAPKKNLQGVGSGGTTRMVVGRIRHNETENVEIMHDHCRITTLPRLTSHLRNPSPSSIPIVGRENEMRVDTEG